MEYTVTIAEHKELDDLLALLANVPVRAVGAIVAGVDKGSQELLSLAMRERFTGEGPFPVSQRKLGVDSGRLRKSLRFSKPEVMGDGVIRVRGGSNVSYFAVHEFGFKGKVSVRAAQVKNTTNMNAFGNNQFSVLAHERAAHTRNVNIPARAPLSAAIEEHSTRVYVAAIEEELSKLINQQ